MELSVYLQPFLRYWGSRPWPFMATWRHRSHRSFDSPRAISCRWSVDAKSLSL